MKKKKYTKEDYERDSELFNSLPTEQCIGVMLQTFGDFFDESIGLVYSPTIPYPFAFLFRDEDLVEDIRKEQLARSLEELTLEEAIEFANEAQSMYRKAPGLCSILNALMNTLNSAVAVQYIMGLNQGCLIIVRDQELFHFLTATNSRDN